MTAARRPVAPAPAVSPAAAPVRRRGADAAHAFSAALDALQSGEGKARSRQGRRKPATDDSADAALARQPSSDLRAALIGGALASLAIAPAAGAGDRCDGRDSRRAPAQGPRPRAARRRHAVRGFRRRSGACDRRDDAGRGGEARRPSGPISPRPLSRSGRRAECERRGARPSGCRAESQAGARAERRRRRRASGVRRASEVAQTTPQAAPTPASEVGAAQIPAHVTAAPRGPARPPCGGLRPRPPPPPRESASASDRGHSAPDPPRLRRRPAPEGSRAARPPTPAPSAQGPGAPLSGAAAASRVPVDAIGFRRGCGADRLRHRPPRRPVSRHRRRSPAGAPAAPRLAGATRCGRSTSISRPAGSRT